MSKSKRARNRKIKAKNHLTRAAEKVILFDQDFGKKPLFLGGISTAVYNDDDYDDDLDDLM